MGRGFVKQTIEQSALNKFEKRFGGFDPTGASSFCFERETLIELFGLFDQLGSPFCI
jgi:hypothetical protein